MSWLCPAGVYVQFRCSYRFVRGGPCLAVSAAIHLCSVCIENGILFNVWLTLFFFLHVNYDAYMTDLQLCCYFECF